MHLQKSAGNKEKGAQESPTAGYRCLQFSTLTSYCDCILGQKNKILSSTIFLFHLLSYSKNLEFNMHLDVCENP